MKKLLACPLIMALVLAACADPSTEAQRLAASQPAAALEPLDAPADFRGVWILNTDRGENLGMMKAVNETIVATQNADSITFDMTDVFAGMTTTRTIVYDLNGAVMQNKAAMGAESETVTRWDGEKLVTTWTEEGAIAGTETQRTETRWLSEGGKTLSVSMVRGDNPPLVFVFEKAE
jgi:hypothetical protein